MHKAMQNVETEVVMGHPRSLKT